MFSYRRMNLEITAIDEGSYRVNHDTVRVIRTMNLNLVNIRAVLAVFFSNRLTYFVLACRPAEDGAGFTEVFDMNSEVMECGIRASVGSDFTLFCDLAVDVFECSYTLKVNLFEWSRPCGVAVAGVSTPHP